MAANHRPTRRPTGAPGPGKRPARVVVGTILGTLGLLGLGIALRIAVGTGIAESVGTPPAAWRPALTIIALVATGLWIGVVAVRSVRRLRARKK